MTKADRIVMKDTDPERDGVFYRFSKVVQRLALDDAAKLPWVIAVSGGSDSVALMHLAATYAAIHAQSAPVVLTVDHGLRADAAAEAAQVGRWAERLGLAHETLRWSGDAPDRDIQAAARRVRYSLMGAYCAEHGLSTLLTAHTQDDQAETFLLRLARGSGVEGLSAMRGSAPLPCAAHHSAGIRLVRPLLSMQRAHLRAYLAHHGHEWLDDPSNRDEHFARVRMRNLLPLLAQEGLTVDRLARTAQNLRFAHETVASVVQDLRETCAAYHPAGYIRVEAYPFFEATRHAGMQLLAEMLKAVGGCYYKPRFAALERLYEALKTENEVGQGRTLSGCRIVPHYEYGHIASFLIMREMRSLQARLNKVDAPLHLHVGEKVLWDNRFDVWLEGPATSDTALVGEVRPLGAEGCRQLRDAVSTSHEDSRVLHMPSPVRRTLPALWQGEHVLACPFHGIVNEQLFPGNLGKTAQMRAAFRMV